MQGLGTIVRMNDEAARRVHVFARDTIPAYRDRIRRGRTDKRGNTLEPAPVLWGNHLVAVAWHSRHNGVLVSLEVTRPRLLKRLWRRFEHANSNQQEKK